MRLFSLFVLLLPATAFAAETPPQRSAQHQSLAELCELAFNDVDEPGYLYRNWRELGHEVWMTFGNPDAVVLVRCEFQSQNTDSPILTEMDIDGVGQSPDRLSILNERIQEGTGR